MPYGMDGVQCPSAEAWGVLSAKVSIQTLKHIKKIYLFNINFNTFTSNLGIEKKEDRIEFIKSFDPIPIPIPILLLKRIFIPISILKKMDRDPDLSIMDRKILMP